MPNIILHDPLVSEIQKWNPKKVDGQVYYAITLVEKHKVSEYAIKAACGDANINPKTLEFVTSSTTIFVDDLNAFIKAIAKCPIEEQQSGT